MASTHHDTATWQVVVIKHGTRATTRSDAYLNYAFYGEPDGPHRVDYYLWVLRRGDEVVIVDTGYSGVEGRARGREVLIDPIEALRALGVDPDAGHPVVLTHAHYDHIGNLPAFTASEVHIAQSEMDFWTSDIATRPLFSHFGDPLEVEELLRIASAAPGYTSVLNGRFKGGHITRQYGEPARGIHAVQMELTQCSYMQEALRFGYLPERAMQVQPHLRRMLEAVLSFAQRAAH